MIRDGVIIYDAQNVSFWSWQLDSEELNAVMVGLLSTMFAYQLTASFYNIRFGNKRKGLANASDIQKLMLTEYGSPLMIFAAITRYDVLDILRFKGDLPLSVKIARRDAKVRKRTAFGLIALLSVAPLFNITSIFIAMQRDGMVTVNQGSDCGFALGVSTRTPDIRLIRARFRTGIRTHCDRILSEVVGPATSLLKFSWCYDLQVPSGVRLTGGDIRLSAETTNLGQIKVSVISIPSNIPVSVAIHVDVSSEGQLFRIQPLLPFKSAAKIVHDGQEKLSNSCESAKLQNSPHDEELLKDESSNGLLKVSKDFSCNISSINASINVFAGVAFSMTQIHIIEHAPGFNVASVESMRSETNAAPEFYDAGKMPLLIRRDRNVNLLPLLILTFVSLVARIVTACVFNNDVEDGIEAIIRHRLAVHPEESLLNSSRAVSYNSKRQGDGMGHFGLPRSQLNVVEEFGKGVEVG